MHTRSHHLRWLHPLRARSVSRLVTLLHRTFTSALEHDCHNFAQAAAYSAMISLFPALILSATIVTWLPDTAPVRFQAALFFDRILPSDVSPLLDSYFGSGHQTVNSSRSLILTALVSLSGASSVMVTLMKGFRRAFPWPTRQWSLWERRWRSFALVPIALFPLLIASALVVFGHVLAQWVAMHAGPSARVPVFLLALVFRWAISLASSIGIIGAIYHMGIPPSCLGVEFEAEENVLRGSVRTMRAMSTMERSWRRTLPGATLATVMWFASTLVFGWYVTRFANYSRVYGPLGAGIALLFWLYIISLSVLCGAEFNAQLYPDDGVSQAK